jgi:uncharacterized protein YgiM (DUF1202 family)
MRRLIWIVSVALVALLGVAVLPAGAQGGAIWNAEFYNNGFLLPPAVLTRQDTAIAFNWGSGSPGSGVNSDGFTARWGTDVFFPAGTYRFWALADDNVRVTVDYQFNPLIDTFAQPRVGQVVSGDITLSAGTHHIQVDYGEAGGDAYVFVTWANLATNPSGPNFPPLGGSGLGTGPWTAQYYANATLGGTPTLIQTESSPTHDWGTGSPVASIPADNFSARWTSTQTLEAGTYQISVRADDGVRVYVDGRAAINQFGPATGQTYTVSVDLSAGQHNFMVEYVEFGGLAFLNYTLVRQGGGVPPPSGGPAMTVTGAFRLNVRAAPDPINGAILTQIRRNETYPIVGRNGDTTWWQINVNGTVGWVSARFVTAFNAQNVPVTSGSSQPVPTATPVITGSAATVTGASRLNVRNAPNPISGQVLTRISRGDTFPVVGRNVDASWWQLNVNGVIGWVNARYVTVVNAQNVPVTSNTTNPSSPAPIVQCPGFLPSRLTAGRQGRVLPGLSNNFRDQPSLSGNVIGQIPGGAAFSVITGPQCSSGYAWWQVNFNGVIGWTAEGRGNVYWLEPV